ncbi:MAG: hypothetical protein OXH63_08890, partial [Gemmatimonadetes bacterium]|nr:hypothetical protein [Gemmatimonadota bacterium]
TMQDLDAALADDGSERVGVFLTNALTGWEPTDKEKQVVTFPELKEERDKANKVKRERPILVILGNPPYNGFAGVAMEEERELSTAYRTTKKVRRPQGQGLNDLYVRFFRMAERRIAEKTGQGVVCFISNYSWLDGLSFTGMRERYLEAFDTIRIDNLHGDRIISEYTPDGRTSETVFAVRGKSPGIRIGTSITMLSKSGDGNDSDAVNSVRYRDFHEAKAEERRRVLLSALDANDLDSGYATLIPEPRIGLPFKPVAVSDEWFDWPSLPDLFPVSFPGVKTSRDSFLVDIDQNLLQARITDYFNEEVSHEEIGRRYPSVMKTTARFGAVKVREGLLARGRMDLNTPNASEVAGAKRTVDAEAPEGNGVEPGTEVAGPNGLPSVESVIVRFAYRPFDNRWLYWERDTKLLDEKRSDYKPHVFDGNLWLSAAQHLRKGADEPQTCFTESMAALHLIERGANMFPVWLQDDGVRAVDGMPNQRANLLLPRRNTSRRQAPQSKTCSITRWR